MGLFSFVARLGLDGTNFETGILRAKGVGEKFAGFLKNEVGAQIAAAFSVGAVVAFTKSVINAADNIGDLSDQLNITTDDVQRLQVLATQTGVKFEKMSGAILKTNEARAKALESDGPERKAFAELGVSIGMLADRNTTNLQIIEKIGQSYAASGKSVEKQAALSDILSVKLVTAAGAIADIQKLGPINLISEDQIKKLSEANDKLDEAKRRAIVAFAPSVASTMDFAADRANRISSSVEFGQKVARVIPGENAASKGARFNVSAVAASAYLLAYPLISRFTNRQAPLQPSPTGGPSPGPLGNINIGKDDPMSATKYNLGQASDNYAKIGIFTQFGSQQDRMIIELREQKRELAYIRKASETTAKAVT